MDGAHPTETPEGAPPEAHHAYASAYLELPPPRTRPQLASFVARATVEGLLHRRSLREVERFFFMIGYTHSGSTLVGTLLNAHPEMVIAQEVDCLRYVRPGITRNALFAMVLMRDREFATIDRSYHGFEYAVPDGDQGRFTNLRVIGDKHAGRAIRRLDSHPGLLDRTRARVGVPIRVLHLLRNPFDNIASIARNREMPLTSAIEIYRRLGNAVDRMRTEFRADELCEIRYEQFIADPTGSLDEVCRFIGVETTPRYLSSCATLIDAGGRRGRHRASWAPDEIRLVEDLIAARPCLAGYSFSD